MDGNAWAQTSPASCVGAGALAARLDPLARGDLAALNIAKASSPVVDVNFLDGEGTPKKLSGFRGKIVLLNLWATWCVPCRAEMPALNALQEKLGGPDFEVVAVNIDTRDLAKPREWLKTASVDKLAYYADPSGKIFQELRKAGKAFGMPTTLLVDRQGCELAVLAGPAEWSSEDALALIRAALEK